jgi:hypothetical protein
VDCKTRYDTYQRISTRQVIGCTVLLSDFVQGICHDYYSQGVYIGFNWNPADVGNWQNSN